MCAPASEEPPLPLDPSGMCVVPFPPLPFLSLPPSGMCASISLVHLDLEENDLNSDACASLAKLVRTSKQLAWLRVDGERGEGGEGAYFPLYTVCMEMHGVVWGWVRH